MSVILLGPGNQQFWGSQETEYFNPYNGFLLQDHVVPGVEYGFSWYTGGYITYVPWITQEIIPYHPEQPELPGHPVPESSTTALLLLGFVCILLASRLRRMIHS